MRFSGRAIRVVAAGRGQELPASVTREIPMVLGYKFVKLDDRILLVSPIDRSVVAEMPRYRTMLN